MSSQPEPSPLFVQQVDNSVDNSVQRDNSNASIDQTHTELLENGSGSDNDADGTHLDNENAESVSNNQEEMANDSEYVKGLSKGLPRATLAQKIEAIQWHDNHGAKTQRFTVRYFQQQQRFAITSSALGRWIRTRDVLFADFERMSQFSSAKFKKRSYVKHALVDHCVAKQYEEWLFDHHKFTYQDLKDEWYEFARLVYPEQRFEEGETKSNGWISYFHQKMKLKTENIQKHQEYLLENSRELVSSERTRIQSVVKRFKPCDVFHFDELALTTRVLPVEHIEQKFIVGLGVNSDITEFLPPLILSKDPELIIYDDYYQSNTNMLNAEIIYKYFQKINRSISFSSPERKILVLLDRLHEHVVKFDELHHIEVCWFNADFQTTFSNLDGHIRSPPLLSVEIQPLNLGVIKNFKLNFKANLLKHYMNIVQVAKYVEEQESHTDPSSSSSSSLPILKVTNQTVYELIHISFDYIKHPSFHDYIKQCWSRSGVSHIYPNSARRLDGVYNMVKDQSLESLFYKLVKTLELLGHFQHPSTFSLDDLLFPKDELIINVPLSRMDILALARAEMQIMQRPYQLGQLKDNQAKEKEDLYTRSSILNQLSSLDPLLTTQLKPFFEDNVKYFPKSLGLFEKFMTSYIIESMDYQFSGESVPPNGGVQ